MAPRPAPAPRSACTAELYSIPSTYAPPVARAATEDPKISSIPLKHSLRNLLVLLKKGGKHSDKDKAVFPPISGNQPTGDALHKDLPLLPIPLEDADRPALSRSQTEIGSLIYLTESPFDPNTPEWVLSKVTLKGSTINVGWLSHTGVSHAREISLVGCSNIRSVSDLRSLGSKERDALPMDGDEHLKVFELLFKDRSRSTEWFAVSTIRERAKWISAFWNAILPSGELSAVSKENTHALETVSLEVAPLPPALQTTSTSGSRALSRPLPRRTATDRSLPPIPLDITRTSSGYYSPPVPPLTIVKSNGTLYASPLPMSGASMLRIGTSMTARSLPIPPPISPIASSVYSSMQSPTRSTYSQNSALQDASDRWSPSPVFSRGPPPLSARSPSQPLAPRSHSESIANLSRLSKVKERRAQFESSSSSAEGRTSYSLKSEVKSLAQNSMSQRMSTSSGAPSPLKIAFSRSRSSSGGGRSSQARTGSHTNSKGSSPLSRVITKGGSENHATQTLRGPKTGSSDARFEIGDRGVWKSTGGENAKRPFSSKEGSGPRQGSLRKAGSMKRQEMGKTLSTNTPEIASLLNRLQPPPPTLPTDGLPVSSNPSSSEPLVLAPAPRRVNGSITEATLSSWTGSTSGSTLRDAPNPPVLQRRPTIFSHRHEKPASDMVEVMDTLTSIQSILGGGSSQPLGSGTPPSAHDNSNTLGTTGLHPDTGVKHTGAGSSGTLHQITLGLEYELKGAGQTLKEVKATVQSIEKRLEATVPSPSKSRFDAHRTSPSDTALDSNASALNDEVLDVLLAVKAQLNAALPGLGKGLGKVSVGQNAFMENVKMQGADLGPLERRLDDLMKVGKSSQAILRDRMIGKDLLAEVSHLTSLMEGDRAHREQQLLQQADSVRYLNELNTWLEAFVNNGATQIQTLATGIEQLSAALGHTTTGSPSDPTLLHDVRRLILGMKARDKNMASLQAAVNDLVVAIGSSESKTSVDSQAIVHLMESQQRTQETMLKLFTDEISDEIKGERLRFVDAMKEATAINVQLHVDQLKKEMGKQVFVMAREVERLHRDKQEVEHQISELMALYSNHTPNNSFPPPHPLTLDPGRPNQSHAHRHQHSSMIPVVDLRMKPLGSGGGSNGTWGGHVHQATPSRGQQRQATVVEAQARPLPFPKGSY